MGPERQAGRVQSDRGICWLHGSACAGGETKRRGSNSIVRNRRSLVLEKGVALWREGWGREQTSYRPMWAGFRGGAEGQPKNAGRSQRGVHLEQAGRKVVRQRSGTAPQGTSSGRTVTQKKTDFKIGSATAWGGVAGYKTGASGRGQNQCGVGRDLAAGAGQTAGSRLGLGAGRGLCPAGARVPARDHSTRSAAKHSAAQRSLQEHVDALHGVAGSFVVAVGGLPHVEEGGLVAPLLHSSENGARKRRQMGLSVGSARRLPGHVVGFAGTGCARAAHAQLCQPGCCKAGLPYTAQAPTPLLTLPLPNAWPPSSGESSPVPRAAPAAAAA